MYNNNKRDDGKKIIRAFSSRRRSMCTFIKMEYLVASALIELYEKKKVIEISLEEVKNYGVKVEEELLENNIRAILLYSNDYTKQFLCDFSQWFEEENGKIKIKEGVTTNDIRENILSYAPFDLFIALLSEFALKELIAQK